MRVAVLLCIVAVTCLPAVNAKRVRGANTAASKKRELSNLPVAGDNHFKHRTVDEGWPGQVLYQEDAVQEASIQRASIQEDWKRTGKGKAGKADSQNANAAQALADGTWTWKSSKKCKSKKSTKSPSSFKSTKSPSSKSKVCEEDDQATTGGNGDPGTVTPAEPAGGDGDDPGDGTANPAAGTVDPAAGTAVPAEATSPPTDGNEPQSGGTDPASGGNNTQTGGNNTDSTPDSIVVDTDTCELIENKTKPIDLDDNTLVDITGVLSITSALTPAEVVDVLDVLEVPVALWVAGCRTRADAVQQRKLQDVPDVGYAELSNFTAGTCLAGISLSDLRDYCFLTLCVAHPCYLGEACDDITATAPSSCVQFSSVLKVWRNDVTEEVIRQRLIDGLARFAKLASDNDDIDAIFVVGSGDDSGGDTAKAVRGSNAIEEDEGLNAGGAVGIAAGCLAIMLLLVLLVKRRQDSDEVSHLKLEEEGENTFIHELDTASQPSNEYSPRNAHVVGEEDSIFSGWTGYPTKDNSFDDQSEGVEGVLGARHGDVHHCSSATCEVCEKKRQQGLKFIGTGSPPRPVGLPSDAARDYVEEDTVEL